MVRPFTFCVLALLLGRTCLGHDIPNARVDRAIQLNLRPGLLEIGYEVSLSELTLVRDLRELLGQIPEATRQDLFHRYGTETGPLNAKGLLISVDGREVEPAFRRFEISVEDHPRYLFHFEAKVAPQGRLAFRDTNFSASEGTSRLAIRAQDGIRLRGEEYPSNIEQVPARPVWQLTDQEERRTKELEVDYAPGTAPIAIAAPKVTIPPAPQPTKTLIPSQRLAALLDAAPKSSFWGLIAVALGLGAFHALQPGHGKTLVAGATLGNSGQWLPAAVLALTTTITHTGSVLIIAAGLWLTQSSRYGTVHQVVAQLAGFLIAAIGLWRLGRYLGGYEIHAEHLPDELPTRFSSWLGLGFAAGIVPCWDAIALIVIAEAVGRLALGIVLLLAFSGGMALVLLGVGWAAARLRNLFTRNDTERGWERALGISSGVILSLIGILILATS